MMLAVWLCLCLVGRTISQGSFIVTQFGGSGENCQRPERQIAFWVHLWYGSVLGIMRWCSLVVEKS